MIRFRLSFLIALLCLFHSIAFAQNGVVTGKVVDAQTGGPLIGVNIVLDDAGGTTTDFDGNYHLEVEPGSHKLSFRYVGYDDVVKNVTVNDGQPFALDVSLKETAREIDAVVVSASKYEKKLSEETVSIEVLKSDLIENSNATDVSEAMDKVPSVTIIEGQANIRGGAGWSYGAGSRVMVLVDDIPLLAADAADAKWSIMPVENIEQIEVIKGAASALYGSSALNGIINVRTAWPTNEPYTKFVAYHGIYDKPENEARVWWDDSVGTGSKARWLDSDREEPRYLDNTPMLGGFRFAHRRKIKQFDLVLGGNYYGEKSYLYGDSEQQVRLNVKTRYRPKNIRGLSFGLNTTLYRSKGSVFFIWDGNDSLSYLPLPNSVSNFISTRITVDPFVTYFDKNNNRYSLKGRYFNSLNENDTEQGSRPQLFWGEFQFQRYFIPYSFNIVAGVSGYYADVTSPTGSAEESLIGEHYGNNLSGYLQMDKKFFDKLSVALGVRYEYFRIDTFDGNSKPVLRLGLNYQAARATYIRASVGQGYRFPTMAEKFIRTNVGAVGIYPNPGLEAETGWSAELGVKQGFMFGNWQGYVDVAGFINQYENMMEFTFGRFGSDKSIDNLLGLGFSSQNIGDTRIVGGDFTLVGQGKIGANVTTRVLAGYTYIVPKSLNWDENLEIYDEQGNNAFFAVEPGSDSTYATTSTSEENFLKYRHQHTFKIDVETTIKSKLTFGASLNYLSFMENIDKIFVSEFIIGLEDILGTNAFEGLKTYRQENEGKGDYIIDLRAGYEVIEGGNISFIVKNVLNEDKMIRPALLDAPRIYTIQLSYEF